MVAGNKELIQIITTTSNHHFNLAGTFRNAKTVLAAAVNKEQHVRLIIRIGEAYKAFG
jgi:hypothetical protein